MLRLLSKGLLLWLVLCAAAMAQEQDITPAVYAQIKQMKKLLHLTEAQAQAVSPIVKDYVIKRQAILEQASGTGILDHRTVKSTLESLREKEDRKLSRVLSKDQLQKWVDRENLLATMNPDNGGSMADDSGGVGLEGATLKF
ncbi:MAG: hypothetical protein KGK03_08280 [Candidatus Omnitrophica bacterium]|nr:hypothetical protein [Candidatus Omnitrophota bacterium]